MILTEYLLEETKKTILGSIHTGGDSLRIWIEYLGILAVSLRAFGERIFKDLEMIH